MSRHAFNGWQTLFPGTRSQYRQQHCDAPIDRPLDTATVLESEEIDWANTKWGHHGAIDIRSPWKSPRDIGGRSMQKAHSFKRAKFTIGHPDVGYYDAYIPVPAREDGYWIEHNPKPLMRMELEDFIGSLRGSYAFYDRHILLIADVPDRDGTLIWELIGVSRTSGWKAMALARYDKDMNLIGVHPQDKPVTWGAGFQQRQSGDGVPLSSRLWNSFDPPHRLAMSLKGNDFEKMSFPWANDWLALDGAQIDWGVLSLSEKLLAESLVAHGAVIDDHGSTRISVVDGAQATSYSNLSNQLAFGKFRRVTKGTT